MHQERAGRARSRVTAGVLAGAVLAAAAAATTGGPAAATPSGGATSAPDQPEPLPAASGAPAVLADPAPVGPTGRSRPYAAALAPLLSARTLGPSYGAAVVDLTTGRTVHRTRAGQLFVPASVTKLFSSAAVLERLGPDHRFTTRVVRGARADQLVLVGGGDPMLSTEGGQEESGTARTPLGRLARETVLAVRAQPAAQRPRRVLVQVDDALFAPPSAAPSWERGYVSGGVVGLVGALTLDGGRVAPGDATRVPDPGRHAGAVLAARLTQLGLPATAGPRVRAAASAPVLASVTSTTLARIVEHTLEVSDNDVSEVLGRQTAVSAGLPATAATAPAAVLGTLRGLGVDLSGAVLRDTSGVSRRNLLEPAQVTSLLAVVAGGAHPRLGPVLSGMAVAGVTGTLGERFTAPGAAAGRGVVRAKTGSLTGVVSLAGTTLGRDGRTYAFAFLADEVTPAASPRPAYDAAASALAACGCT